LNNIDENDIALKVRFKIQTQKGLNKEVIEKLDPKYE